MFPFYFLIFPSPSVENSHFADRGARVVQIMHSVEESVNLFGWSNHSR